MKQLQMIGLSPQRLRCCRWVLILCCVGFTSQVGLTSAKTSAKTLVRDRFHSCVLLPDITADIFTDGGLQVISASNERPLLSGVYVSGKASTAVTGFSAVARAGDAGGRYGFSAHRDDDNDGQINEDPLDGLDNDGDGLVDEDYAAIGETMAVWNRRAKGVATGGSHGEFYHWSNPGLRSILFLNVQDTNDEAAFYRLKLRVGQWQEATAVSGWHSAQGQSRSGRVETFVAPLAASVYGNDPQTRLWIGVVVLSDSPQLGVVLQNRELKLKSNKEPMTVAVCIAESWLQLNRELNEAARVRQGITDAISGRQSPWLAPARCALCRVAAVPRFSVFQDSDKVMSVDIPTGWGVPLDPDLFRLDGQALGSPREIQWFPTHGDPVIVPWAVVNEMRLADLKAGLVDPFAQMSGLRNHRVAGRLLFVFARPLAVTGDGVIHVSGVDLNGYGFNSDLIVVPSKETRSLPNFAPTAAVKPLRQPLSLDLLEGFPNPFRETIQLRFVVPATIGEAFAWDKKTGPPPDLDLGAAPPWLNGSPHVSVKIYSINGQELVTLFAGSMDPGESRVHWSGTDNFGRQVASGTYFCKLQLDRWSVTRRLVFLR